MANAGRFSHACDHPRLVGLGIRLEFTAIAAPGCLLQTVCFCWEVSSAKVLLSTSLWST